MTSKNSNAFKASYNAAKRLHCDDGPAIIWNKGIEEWYLDGLRHREDGPAVKAPDGYEEWWINGSRHRIGGPAIVYSNYKYQNQWWENGTRISLHRFQIDENNEGDWSLIHVRIR
jgi:hypothetical protein